LDPFGEYQDEAIWDALEKAHLKEQFSQWEGGLSHEVPRELRYTQIEGGLSRFQLLSSPSFFSTGQRQLICLARAILQNLTRILVLEEATDACDCETHVQMQEAIRNHFKSLPITN
jgi:ABC-type multidrug transport system fused ATPase/permease subunit